MDEDMRHVKDWHKPESCFAERFTQAPLDYVERQNKTQEKEASQLRKQDFKGRYSK